MSSTLLWLALGVTWAVLAFVIWLQLQVMKQSGAILTRLESVEANPGKSKADPYGMTAGRDDVKSPGHDPFQEPLLESGSFSEYDGLLPGAPAPSFELPDLDGKRRKLEDWRGKPVLIVFFSPQCGFCTEIAPDLAAMPVNGEGGGPVPIIVTNGTVAENREWIDEYKVGCTVLIQKKMEVANRYQATGTPMGYLIDAEGKIASKMAVGGPPIVDLIPPAPGMKKKPLSESKIARDGLKKGTVAPDFDLPDVQNKGSRVALADYRGRKTLLVFTDPQCGPCEELAPELEKLHRSGKGPAIVMVSRGDPAANRAKVQEHGLTMPVGLQKQWEISKQYAMFATPIGYLVDEQGVLAEDVAVGVDSVLALARRDG